MAQYFLEDPTLWVLLSFISFMVLAYVLGRRSVLGMMDAKIEKIRQQITSAEVLKSEAEALLFQYKSNLANASTEAEAIIAKAKAQAADYRKQAEVEFDETIARREDMLKSRIEQMERSAVDDIRRYAAELAVSASTEIISQRLSSSDVSRLADQSIQQISEKLN
ncbi:MAG: hypothetical protein RBR86_00695 [Pseudobdellovibrionaceae bacterium]|jgi:F-type H+-transporting ATPase subunit b|nr:hypothetical protein [Pseudobdellovibrionaceae bacterium]